MASEATLTTLIGSITTALNTALGVVAPNELDKTRAEQKIAQLIESKLYGTNPSP